MHSGKPVNMVIKPAPPNHGIQFKRVDLPDSPCVPALFNKVVDTSLATVLGYDGFIVSTIEHLMACFSGMGIDNVLVEIDHYEVPIMDGSAEPFTVSIMQAGVQEQPAPRCFFFVKKPVVLSQDDKFVGIYPSLSFKITYTIVYDHHLINSQTFSLDICEAQFAKEISPARTYGFFHEIEYLRRYGFARGGSLDNAIVITEDAFVNNEGLRFPDELVRHKILDCIGDFALLGLPLCGHVVAHRSGHFFNHLFIQKFLSETASWETLYADEMSTGDRAAAAKQLAI